MSNCGEESRMKCVRVQDGGRLNARLNGELLEEVESFKYLRLTIVVNGRMDVEVCNRVKEAVSAWVE